MSRVRLLLIITLLFAVPALYADAPSWSEVDGGAMDAGEQERIAHAHLDEVPPDYAEARRWFRAAADQGSDRAMAYLGWFYEEGRGVSTDGERAAKWYARAVDAGARQYTLHLGWMYLQGELLERDRVTAEAWFRRGIDTGIPEARLALGSIYFADAQSSGDRADGREAESLLLSALEAGALQATRFLGRMYVEGIGVEPDPERGVAAVRLGAAAGDGELQLYLARLLAAGDAVERDTVKAYTWALVAEQGATPGARDLLEVLEANLDQGEQEAAREDAERLAARHG